MRRARTKAVPSAKAALAILRLVFELAFSWACRGARMSAVMERDGHAGTRVQQIGECDTRHSCCQVEGRAHLHALVQGVQHQGHAHKVMGWVAAQVFPELPAPPTHVLSLHSAHSCWSCMIT